MSEDIYTLVIQFGRKDDDGLPEGATGGAMIAVAPAANEKAAVDDTVRLLKEAGLAPIEVESYGTMEERRASGYEFTEEELECIELARGENAIIVVQKTLFYDEDDDGARH